MSAILAWSLAGCLAAAPLAARDPQPLGIESSAVQDAQRLIDLARSGKAVIRPQAAQRLIRLGDEGAKALLAAAGTSTADFAALGKDLVEVAGAFDSPELRAKLWRSLDDADFPWRPAAAIGLKDRPQAGEQPRFLALIQDPLAAVRNAAVLALGQLEDLDTKATSKLLAARLPAEEDDRVRRSIAVQLDRWGERWALWYLVADLRRTDAFFGQPTGSLARLRSYPLLAERLGAEDLGFAPAEGPETPSNTAALGRIAVAVEAVAGKPIELPPVARSLGPVAGERLGLELRSCRRGEFFLRWTEDDTLLVGRGTPARVQLAKGATQALADLAAKQALTLDGRLFWGDPGCDQETFHLGAPGQPGGTVLLSKGPQPVDGLRPQGLDVLAREILAGLPSGASEDPRLDSLRSRVEACLLAIGGPLKN